MADSYPYMISNNKIEPIFEKIRKAAEPSKFTHSFLKNLGFKSTNDRGIIPLLKALGFLLDNGSPTDYYRDLRDETIWQSVLGNQIKELYSDLYTINTEIQNATDDEIKGAISRVTGKDSKTVIRYFNTFKTLIKLAEFEGVEVVKEEAKEESKPKETIKTTNPIQLPRQKDIKPDFHYNIQIHLPATTDISVYNAIFKSIKENLME